MRDSVLIGPGQSQARPKPLLRTTLGQILRRARRGQGRTLADVARAARVSMPYLSELERGRKEASSEVLAAVCDALRIELSDLLAEAGRRLADERARRALIEERARRRKQRAGELPPDITERPAEVPAVTADKAGAAGAAGAAGPADRCGRAFADRTAARPGGGPAGCRPQPAYPVGRRRPGRRPGPRRLISSSPRIRARRVRAGPGPSAYALSSSARTPSRVVMTWSASPYSTASRALNVLSRSVSSRIWATG